MPVRDLIGCRFGRLVVIDRAPNRVQPSGYKDKMWKCQCDCGNKVVVRGKSLTRGVTHSCGCFAKELMSKRMSKHRGFGTRLYNIWDSMRQRCNNQRCHAYHNYGGRGISVCSEWDDFAAFREWALSAGYDDAAERGKYTLDRIDTDGDYCPGNCRWVNMKVQGNNRRCTVYITHNGETHPLKEWAEITGVKYETLWARYHRGLPPEQVLKRV